MGRPKTIDDSRILAEARAVFERHGAAASTREIARAVGISQAVLYQRFGSKEDLFFRAMTPEAPDLLELLAVDSSASVEESLERIGDRLAIYLTSLVRIVIPVLASSSGHERLARWHDALPFRNILHGVGRMFAELRREGRIAAVDPHAAAVTFLAGVHAVAFARTLGAHGPAAHVTVRSVVSVLWAGLAPEGVKTKSTRRRPSAARK